MVGLDELVPRRVSHTEAVGTGGAPPASFSNLISEFAYSGDKLFFHMALRLKDSEVFSQFCWGRFEILDLKKLTICLYNYNGKHLFMMK